MTKREYTGGSVSYYRIEVTNPTSEDVQPYTAECNDIIEALGMNYAEGNAFKAIWRSCAARNLGLSKDGYKDGVYDAEKVEFFGARMVAQARNTPAESQSVAASPDEGWIVNDGTIPAPGPMILEYRGGAHGVSHSKSNIDWGLIGDDRDIIRYKRIK